MLVPILNSGMLVLFLNSVVFQYCFWTVWYFSTVFEQCGILVLLLNSVLFSTAFEQCGILVLFLNSVVF
jgi:hypothetical protein